VTRRLTAAEVGDKNIEMAAHPRTAGPSLAPFAGSAELLLRMPRPRVVPLPEPVPVLLLNGRVPEPWETELITGTRLRERAAEAVLLGGLT